MENGDAKMKEIENWVIIDLTFWLVVVKLLKFGGEQESREWKVDGECVIFVEPKLHIISLLQSLVIVLADLRI